jgi:hypothetical protein
MKAVNYIWLIFPVSILIAGFMVLNENLFPNEINQAVVKGAPVTDIANKQSAPRQNEKALPYFILGSIFTILILVLPRLQELSISDKSLVLKLVKEVKDEASQLQSEVPLNQAEALRPNRSNDKLVSIREKIALIEQVLNKGK